VGGALGLANVPDRLMRMLVLTGVDAVLPVHATAAEAVATMTAGLSTSAPVQGSVIRVFADGAEGEHTSCDNAQHPSSNLN
jgi:anti-sigma B factor antagonist